MENILLALVAFIGTVLIAIIQASIRPWKYCLSGEYRKKIRCEWKDKSKFLKFMHVFGGFVALVLSIAVIGLILWFFLIREEPDPSAIEKLENKATEIFIETIRKANEGSE